MFPAASDLTLSSPWCLILTPGWAAQ